MNINWILISSYTECDHTGGHVTQVWSYRWTCNTSVIIQVDM